MKTESSRRRATFPIATAMSLALSTACGVMVWGGAEPATVPHIESSVAAADGEAPSPAPEAPPTLPAWSEPFFPFLDDEPSDVSVSVGDTSHGWIVNASAVTESDALAILPRQRERALAHGSDQLVAVIEQAARDLHAATGTRLWIGNVGRRGGGDIEWSVSHNSGRDADIAFCYRDAAGKPVDPPNLVPLDREGFSKDRKLRFDPTRTWLVVRSMLESEAASVQYLFISHSLKVQLLAAARRQGAPATLIERANVILRQPGGSHPHDDHLHLRVYCSERDVAGGCIDGGAMHPFARRPLEARARRIAEVSERLFDHEPEQRRRAILRLGLLAAEEHVDAISTGLIDRASIVRVAAAEALASLRAVDHVPHLIEAFRRENETAVHAALADAIGRLGGPESGPFLRGVIADPSGGGGVLMGAVAAAARVTPAPLLLTAAPMDRAGRPLLAALGMTDPGTAEDPDAPLGAIRMAAIRAAARADRLEPAGALLPLLSSDQDALRHEVASTLSFITNRPFDLDPERATKLFDQMKGQSRGMWLVTGFAAAGYRVRTLDQRSVWELVRAIGGDEPVGYNAIRTLVNIAGEGHESLSWSRAAACRHWLRYFDARAADFSLPRPPPAVRRACWALKDR